MGGWVEGGGLSTFFCIVYLIRYTLSMRGTVCSTVRIVSKDMKIQLS